MGWSKTGIIIATLLRGGRARFDPRFAAWLPNCDASQGIACVYPALCPIYIGRRWDAMATDSSTSIDDHREQLADVLAEWGTRVSELLDDLAAAQARVAEAEAEANRERVEELEHELKSQSDLLTTLESDAREAQSLRAEIYEKDLEMERQISELRSKRELIQALRQEGKRQEQKYDDLRKGLEAQNDLCQQLDDSKKQVAALNRQILELEAIQEEAAEGGQEAETLKTELEARKMVIKSLRADLDHLKDVDAQLAEKQEVIAGLEATTNRQAETIAELNQTVAQWKRRAMVAKATPVGETATSLPALTETDVRALANVEVDQTLAIDMKDPLHEARAAARSSK